MCGEQDWNPVQHRAECGSSPRVRGTVDAFKAFPFHGRFIPACAGNSAKWTTTNCANTVHPRVCGEQNDCLLGHVRYSGSSPAWRGTDREKPQSFCHKRFIPRVRGTDREKPQSFCHKRFIPRVRGTEAARPHRPAIRRFIPACAGNRLCRFGLPGRDPVHPRVGGEQLWLRSRNRPSRGSSPRVRGTANPGQYRQYDVRFIPACAGNSHD